MIERTIYECEFCHHKKLINKTTMKQHENGCWYNPKNKTCITCKNGRIAFKPMQKEGYVTLDKRCCIAHPEEIEFDGLFPITDCKYWEQSEN